MPLILLPSITRRLLSVVTGSIPAYDAYAANVLAQASLADFSESVGNTLVGVGPSAAPSDTNLFYAKNTMLVGASSGLALKPKTGRDFVMGSSDFTWEIYVYRDAGTAGVLMGNYRWYIGSRGGSCLNLTSAGVLQFLFSPATNDLFSGTISVPLNQWSHVAISRTGNVFRLTVNGAIAGTYTGAKTLAAADTAYDTGTVQDTSTDFHLGYVPSDSNITSSINARLAHMRVTRGLGRYIAAFTPAPLYTTSLEDWKTAWKSQSDNYSLSSYAYDIPLVDVAACTRVAIGYYNSLATTGLALTNMYSFDLPAEWKTQHPFNYASLDKVVNVKNENTGVVTTGATIRSGYLTFGSLLTDAWAAGNFGRIGITGVSDSPFYNGFSHTAQDNASLSGQNYSTTASSAARRFIILVK